MLVETRKAKTLTQRTPRSTEGHGENLCCAPQASASLKLPSAFQMRGTSGTPRHSKRSRYRCSLPGLAGFAGLRRTEPEVPRIGSRFTPKRLPTQSSTAARAKKENHERPESVFL